MAATNYTPIQLYFSTTASAVPLAANLAQGELAINITDGKLYYEDNAGVVQVIATKGAGTIGGSTTQIQYNNAGALAGNAAMTFNSGTSTTTLTTLNLTNALGATYGGTAQSAYAQGDFLYASATNTLSKLSIGTVNYILTSTGSVPQWSAPSSIIVQTATNLAGGAGGSVPYQSAVDTTTFLAIGAANRVMTSSGTVPQWVTSLTGLTGVSSSSITNTSLTSGRVVVSTTGGAQADDADLTFDGTTLSAGGYSTAGLTTLVKTVKIGDSNFSGVAVFAPATPAKLYIGTGTVTDTTSAIGATNATGAIASLAITPIAATNTSVTYTNASTLYIAGAPSAGTNVTITNPYALYVAAGDAYFGGTVTAGTVNLTTLDLTNLEVTNIKAKDGTASMSIADTTGVVTVVKDQVVNGLTVGRGAGAVATNTAVGASALASNTTGIYNTAFGYRAANGVQTGAQNTAVGAFALDSNTGSDNTGVGYGALYSNTSGVRSTAVGRDALLSNTTASENVAIGYRSSYTSTTGTTNASVGAYSLYSNTTGSGIVAMGYNALVNSTTGGANTALGFAALFSNTTASNNTAVGYQAGYSNTTGVSIVALGYQALNSNTTGNYNIAVGHRAGFTVTTGSSSVFIGHTAGNSAVTTGSVLIGHESGYNSAGNYNTAVGWNAFAWNTASSAGGANAAFGAEALKNNTSGDNNTALGTASLRFNTTASNNTAVGYQAGYSNTTGTGHTALGYQAGYSHTTANRNTLVGIVAGYGLTTGSGNTFIGTPGLGNSAGCGYAMTTGNDNTIIGGFTGNQGGLDIRTASNYIVLSDGAGNPRGIFDGSGNFLVGTTSALTGFSGARAAFKAPTTTTSGIVAQSQAAAYEAGAFWNTDTTSNNTFLIFGTEATYTTRGSITYNRAGGLTVFNTTSDYRAKDISGPVVGSGALIDSVPVYMGKMKWATEERPMFIAHEVPAYAHTGEKDAVDADGNPVYQQMDASALIPVMWAEIQDLRKRLVAAGIA